MGLRHLSDAELTEWAEGEAGATRLPAIEAHLLACQRCSLAVQRIREAAELVERLSAETAPVGLRARAAASYLAEAQAPIACEEAAPLLQEHIDHCLSPAAALMLGPHLDSCRQCRAELATLEATTRALRELPTVESPARVRESILEAQRPAAGSAPFVLRWKPALAAACAVLVVIAIAAVRPASRPVPQPEVVLSAEQPSAGAPSRVEVARVDGDSGRSVADPPAVAAAPASTGVRDPMGESVSVAPRTTPAPAAVTLVAKGPAPEVVTPETSSPAAAMPSGLRALRVVARNTSYDVEVRRAMQLAEEQYATLRSEALSEARLARLPAEVPEAGRGEPETTEGEGALWPLEPESTEERTAPQPSAGSGPSREGAALLSIPLV